MSTERNDCTEKPVHTSLLASSRGLRFQKRCALERLLLYTPVVVVVVPTIGYYAPCIFSVSAPFSGTPEQGQAGRLHNLNGNMGGQTDIISRLLFALRNFIYTRTILTLYALSSPASLHSSGHLGHRCSLPSQIRIGKDSRLRTRNPPTD